MFGKNSGPILGNEKLFQTLELSKMIPSIFNSKRMIELIFDLES